MHTVDSKETCLPIFADCLLIYTHPRFASSALFHHILYGAYSLPATMYLILIVCERGWFAQVLMPEHKFLGEDRIVLAHQAVCRAIDEQPGACTYMHRHGGQCVAIMWTVLLGND